MLSDDTARQLVALRNRAGWTREDLARRCADLGFPALTAPVIGNIETGRRDVDGRRRRDVSVDEWLVLADALMVPPLELLLPLDAVVVEAPSPRSSTSPADVVAWIRGDMNLGGSTRDFFLFREYVRAQDLAWKAKRILSEWLPDSNGERRRPPEWGARYDRSIEELRFVRQGLRSNEHAAPPLPRDLEWIDLPPATDTDSGAGD